MSPYLLVMCAGCSVSLPSNALLAFHSLDIGARGCAKRVALGRRPGRRPRSSSFGFDVRMQAEPGRSVESVFERVKKKDDLPAQWQLFLPLGRGIMGDCRNPNLRTNQDFAEAIRREFEGRENADISAMVFGKRRLSLLIWSSDTDKYMHEASALANKVGGRLLDSTRAPVARIADGDFALVQKFCYAVSSVSVPPQHEGKYRILIDEGKRMLGVHCGWKEMEQVLSKFDSRKEEDEMGAGAFEQIPEHVLLHECDYNNCSDRVNEWPEKVANFYRSAEVEEDT